MDQTVEAAAGGLGGVVGVGGSVVAVAKCGTVAGLSGPGIMSGLCSLGLGSAGAGVAVVAAAPVGLALLAFGLARVFRRSR